MNTDHIIDEIQAGILEITVEDACKRDDLSQKRLLGDILADRLDSPCVSLNRKPTKEELDNPGKIKILDNWQLRGHVFRYRPLHKS